MKIQLISIFLLLVCKGYTQVYPPVTFPFLGQFYYEWIDYNRDGRKDFIIWDEFRDSISVYEFNNLQLTLLSQKQISTNDHPVTVDLAHDGRPEILFSTANSLEYFKNNNGKIGSIVQAVFSPSLDFISFNARDLDNDADADLVVLMSDLKLYIIENINNTFDFNDRVAISSAFTSFGSINFCDYDQDGYVDILFSHPYLGVNIMRRTGHLAYAMTTILSEGSFDKYTTGDFNGDGYPEIVGLFYSGSATSPLGFVRVIENPYGACCAAYYGGGLWFPGDVVVRNLDADPEPEILVCDQASISIFNINAQNVLEFETIYGAQVDSLLAGKETNMILDDFDGDNKLEIIQSVWVHDAVLYQTDFSYSKTDQPYTCDELPIPSLCPPGSLTVNSNEDLIEFNELYPNCKELNSDLVIENVADIELWRAGAIKKVKGNLTIRNTQLDSLDDLNLYAVRGPIVIENNSDLTHIDISNLTSAPQGISLINNDHLRSLNGFNNLTKANKLTVTGNDQLEKINGFNRWEADYTNPFFVTPKLDFIDNPLLDSIYGFAEASEFDFLLDNTPAEWIENLYLVSSLSILNSDLPDLNPFTHVRSNILNLINVSGVKSLAGLNPDALWNFNIRNCKDLEAIGFPAKLNDLISIDNASFHDLTGLNPTQPFLNDLKFINNASLTSLDGLEKISILQGDLVLRDNPQLTDMSAIPDYSAFTDSIIITNNPQLSFCHTPFVCAFLEAGKPNIIEGNAISCENEAAVLDACLMSSATTESGISGISIHPNPLADELWIESDVEVNKVIMYDANGEIVLAQEGKKRINLPQIVAGAYFVKVFTDVRVMVYRVVKL